MTTPDPDSSAIARPGLSLWLRQTGALFADALRRLRAAKLFWVALALSVIVAAACGYVGITPEGLDFPGFGTWENPVWNSTNLPAGEFYKIVFTSFGVGIWLAYAANLLAVISTASLVPALVDEGSVDLYVTRPLGRVRLFLTRYATGLLFVALQALCFSLTAMVVFGVRAGVFLPGLLWAVAFVTLFFSYLYCVSALIGLITGSGVTAILLTLLFWMFVWAADWTEFTTLLFREQAAQTVERNLAAADAAEAIDARMNGPDSGAGEAPRGFAADNLAAARAQLAEARETYRTIDAVHRVTVAVKAPLPKTGETIGELNKVLSDATDLERFEAAEDREEAARAARRADRRELSEDERNEFVRQQASENAGAEAAIDAYYGRPWWWTYATGLGFQAVLLGLCCWIFARRDL